MSEGISYCARGTQSDVTLVRRPSDEVPAAITHRRPLVWLCLDCSFYRNRALWSNGQPHVLMDTPRDAVRHLERHQRVDDRVPVDALRRLLGEARCGAGLTPARQGGNPHPGLAPDEQ